VEGEKKQKIRQNFMSQKYCYNWFSVLGQKILAKKKKLKDM